MKVPSLCTISTIFQTCPLISRLDSEVLLMHVLQVSRSYLYAHPETVLTPLQVQAFWALAERGQRGEPVAYLIGHQEFWSLDLQVTPDTLIPRPETELLVELVLSSVLGSQKIIADLGTGSGAIALAIARERPDWTVYATDNSAAALRIAQQNAKRLCITNILFCEGYWCQALPPLKFDAIVSNPPYIDKNDSDLQPSVRLYEPSQALIAEEEGISDLKTIIHTAPAYLNPQGYLLLEHGFKQAKKIKKLFREARYTNVSLHQDLAGLDRVTMGKKI